MLTACRAHLLAREDALRIQPNLHSPVDPRKAGQIETVQDLGEVIGPDDHQSIRLLKLGSDLGEKGVRGDTYRASEAFSDAIPDSRLDLQSKISGGLRRGLGLE